MLDSTENHSDIIPAFTGKDLSYQMLSADFINQMLSGRMNDFMAGVISTTWGLDPFREQQQPLTVSEYNQPTPIRPVHVTIASANLDDSAVRVMRANCTDILKNIARNDRDAFVALPGSGLRFFVADGLRSSSLGLDNKHEDLSFIFSSHGALDKVTMGHELAHGVTQAVTGINRTNRVLGEVIPFIFGPEYFGKKFGFREVRHANLNPHAFLQSRRASAQPILGSLMQYQRNHGMCAFDLQPLARELENSLLFQDEVDYYAASFQFLKGEGWKYSVAAGIAIELQQLDRTMSKTLARQIYRSYTAVTPAYQVDTEQLEVVGAVSRGLAMSDSEATAFVQRSVGHALTALTN